MQRALHTIVCVLIILLGMCSESFCGVYWEQKVIWGGWTNNMPQNAPEKDQRLSRYYLNNDFYRSENHETIIIIDLNKYVYYRLSPLNKTYFKVSLPRNPESAEPLKSPMGDPVKVKETNETKMISGFKCKKYVIQMMGVKIEHWISDEVPGYALIKEKVGPKLGIVAEFDPTLNQGNPGNVSTPKGIIVHTVKNIMGTMNSTTITRIEERDLDANLFQIPQGYTEIPAPK